MYDWSISLACPSPSLSPSPSLHLLLLLILPVLLIIIVIVALSQSHAGAQLWLRGTREILKSSISCTTMSLLGSAGSLSLTWGQEDNEMKQT
ncbi:hypothetical protein F7725_023149 [Dissostichus mawsoni]|uniref:Uncharacterized protein n=1 Tax=Dissostichus mawsoni TaxID=36200 RepID=A0A7J5YZV9_DISMA|nr:hypothetical protein F7725_023149 [Dissostichus mawsoni]